MKATKIAIRRPVTVSMFIVAVILFGVVSLDRLALNLLPDISYPSLTIQTDFEDAAPEEIESLVTRPIEEVVGVVSGLTRMSSVSRPGQSEVVLEFGWDTNMDLASMDVREKLDLFELPRDVGKPVILRFDPSYDPIMRLQLYGNLSLSRLRYVAENELKKGLESTEGVAAVKVVGGREEEIHIEIDEKRLAELGIPITEVTNTIEQANLNRASGSLYDLDANYLVRMLNEFRSVGEIERVIIRDQEGRKIVLGDIARVWRGTKDREIIARLNGKESVELGIYKEGDANTVTASEAVRAKLEVLTKSKTFPKGVEYQIVFDQAKFISQSVTNVLMAAVLGGLLATIVLFVFLRDVRSTLIIGLSIPISIMATFALMYQTDITLNIMSLGGIALGVGMLVDNSIVVLESVHRHKKAGSSLADGVYRGTQEVGRAVTASTLTTVAVFVPLVFVEGIAGQLFKDQALAITYSLVVSLLVALTFIPMVLALGVKRQAIQSPSESPSAVTDLSGKTVLRVLQHVSWLATTAGRAAGRFIFVDLVQVVLTDLRRLLRAVGRQILKIISPVLNPFGSGFNALNHAYPRALTWSLNNKPVVLAVTVALVGFSAVAYQRLGAELIPPLAQGEFSFEIKLPEGKPLEQTDGIINDIETRIKDFPGVDTVFSSVGGSNKNQFASGALEENFGRLYVVMKDRRDKLGEQRTINKIREELRRHPEVTYTFSRPTLFSFKTPIEVEIYAFDIEDQHTTAGLVAARLERIDGLSDIQSTTQLGNPEIQVRFDRERLARLRLDESEVANILRNKIRGDVASRYREGDKQIEILVRAEASDRSTIADIKNLIINQLGNTDPGQQGDRRASRSRAQNTVSRTPSRNGEQNQDRRRAPTGQIPQQEVERGVPIRLAAIADVVVARGPSEIRRIRSQRAAVVSANLAGRDLSSVSREIRAELQQLRGKIPVNTVIGLGGQNQEMESSYRSLLFALGLAIFLVYLVMASQFESLVHPFVILFTVPLAVVGVILSLFVTATTLSVMVFLGVIILAGIVVNNAIVLIDYTNQLRHKGLSKRQALLEAGQIRLRPIVMTTLTTVLGLFPMALGWGEGAEVRAPMAITVMGGLLFSTMLTLLLIPVVYELVDRKVYVTADAAVIDTSKESEQGMGEAWLSAIRKEES
ncbi:efflux RND transporter permease subunit [Acidobacteria bacterium AH-259-A15]|nr:efflux RND transporter permease subunit [Acidobacteria bacterium AH-259-A15]